LGKFLGGDRLSAVGLLDVLRSTGEQLETLRGPAGLAFSRLATPDADLRTRYLLMGPAGQLATLGDARGTAFLRKSIQSDPEPMVRTLAIELSSGLEAVRPWVMRALEDPNVRVRDAAAQSLVGITEASPFLVRRLLIDDWPMVRAHAATSLAKAGPSEDVDRALGQRLHDESPKVRIAVAGALGARGARALAPALREMADAEREKVLVRSAALRALGQMCDREAADLMTTFAQRAVDPYSPESVSGLGQAAIAALGRLHPPDLQKRLAPLLAAEGPSPQVRAAANAAMTETNMCTKR
jgi:HEAT repeat protein